MKQITLLEQMFNHFGTNEDYQKWHCLWATEDYQKAIEELKDERNLELTNVAERIKRYGKPLYKVHLRVRQIILY